MIVTCGSSSGSPATSEIGGGSGVAGGGLAGAGPGAGCATATAASAHAHSTIRPERIIGTFYLNARNFTALVSRASARWGDAQGYSLAHKHVAAPAIRARQRFSIFSR